MLMLAGLICFIEICQVKYLNNLIEQDHRFIKKITKPMMAIFAQRHEYAVLSILKALGKNGHDGVVTTNRRKFRPSHWAMVF
jgi:transposase-like protein